MLKSNIELVKHIWDEINFILRVTNNKQKDEVIDDDIICRAVVRGLEIIGEASRKIDPEFRSLHPHIEWKKMAGTRDKLINDYFGVDYDIVWDIIQTKLPVLQYFLSQLLDEANL